MFCRRLRYTILLLSLLCAVACSPAAGGGGHGPAYSPEFLEMVKEQPDLSEAARVLESGTCREAIPLLSYYFSRNEQPGPVNYLLGRAQLCLGDFPKGAQHLLTAVKADSTLAADINAVSAFYGRQLVELLQPEARDSYDKLRACYLLLKLSGPGFKLPAAAAPLSRFFRAKVKRGDYSAGLKIVDLMRGLGVKSEGTFALETEALARLGETEKLKELVAREEKLLGEGAGNLVYASALAAEAAYRPGIAAWMFARASGLGCDCPSVHLDAARAWLKDRNESSADAELKQYFQVESVEGLKARELEAAALLAKYDRYDGALKILAAGKARSPGDFDFYKAMAFLVNKAPEQVDPALLMGEYLQHHNFSDEAVELVGSTLLAWRMGKPGVKVFEQVVARSKDSAVALFFSGAFAVLNDELKPATRLWDRAVKSSSADAALLDRIADFLSATGRHEQAEDYLEESLRAAPANIDVLLKLASLKEKRVGDGIKFAERWLKKHPPSSDGLVALSRWCEENGFGKRALKYARKAVAESEGPARSDALLWAGRLHINRRQYEAAVGSFREAAAGPLEPVEFVPRMAVAMGGADNRQLACFAHEQFARLLVSGHYGELPPAKKFLGAMTSLRCGKADEAMVTHCLDSAAEPIEALKKMLAVAHRPADARVLLDVVERSEKGRFDDPGLAATLAVMFARAGSAEQAARFAKEYLAGTTDSPSALFLNARLTLLHGATEAARQILRVAWAKAAVAEKGDVGVLLASLELFDGDEVEGLKVIRELAELPYNRAKHAAAAAGLLIDANKPKAAGEVILDALQDPGSGAGAPPKLKLEIGVDGGPSPGPVTEAELSRMLAMHQAGATDHDVQRRLIAQLAYAWRLQGKSWGELVDKVLPLVSSWHGEHYLAEILMRVSAGDLALELFSTAFRKSPASFALLKAYVDALIFLNYEAGKELAVIEKDVLKIVRKYIKAREGDPDAYRQAATYLEEKGAFSAAEKVFVELADAGHLDATLAMAMARVQASRGKLDEAFANYRLSLSLNACSSAQFAKIVQDGERIGALDRVLELARDCVVKYPREGRLRYVHGRLLARVRGADGTADSLAELNKAVALDPTLLEGAAEFLFARDLSGPALVLARTMVKGADFDQALTGLELGFKILAGSGDTEEMKRLGSQMARAHKRDDRQMWRVGLLYFQYHLMEQGMEKLRQAAATGNAFASLELSSRLVAIGKVKEGLKHFNIFIEADLWKATTIQGRINQAMYDAFERQVDFLARNAGRPDEALKALNGTVKRFPEDPRPRLQLVRLHLAGAKPERAVEHLVEACGTRMTETEVGRAGTLVNGFESQGKLDLVLGSLADKYAASGAPACGSLLLMGLTLAGRDHDTGDLAMRMANDGSISPEQLLQYATLLFDRGRYEEAELLLVASSSREWGREDVLLGVHRLQCRLYSATGRRDRTAEATRMVLLQVPARPEARRGMAGNLFDYEYIDEAERQYNLLDLYDGGSRDTRVALFSLLLRSGRNAEARKLAYRTSFRGENVLNLILTFGSVARRRLEFPLALELYSSALEMDPTNGPLRFVVAELAVATGDSQRAWSLFSEYMATGSDASARRLEVLQNVLKYNHFGMGRLLVKQGDDPALQLHLGLAYLRAGLPEGEALMLAVLQAEENGSLLAREVLDTMVHRPYLLPEKVVRLALKRGCSTQFWPAECRFWEGRNLVLRGEVEPAIKEFRDSLNGNKQTWYYTLGSFRALLRNGHEKVADELLRNQMAGFERTAFLNEAAKTVFSLLHEPQITKEARRAAGRLAGRYINELLQPDPLDFWFRTQRAEAEVLMGENESARARYADEIKKTPWEPGLYNNLAYLLSQMNVDVDQGLELVRDALRREPSHGTYYLDTEGWLLYRKGDLKGAEEKVRASIARANLGFGDSLAEAVYHLGVVVNGQGRKDEALEHFRFAGFVDPFGRYGKLARAEIRKLGLDPYNLDWKPQ